MRHTEEVLSGVENLPVPTLKVGVCLLGKVVLENTSIQELFFCVFD